MNKKKYTIITIIAIVTILGTHLSMLVKISKMQRDLNLLEKKVVEAKKELKIKSNEFERKIDFIEIRRKSEMDFGMEISDHIEYLRVD